MDNFINDSAQRGADFLDKKVSSSDKSVVVSITDNTRTESNDSTVDETPQKEETLSGAVTRLAALPPLEYEQVRETEAKQLSVRVAILDEEIKKARKANKSNDDQPFADIEPYPDPINPTQLLNEISETIRKFVVLDVDQAHAAALWTAFTWFIDDVKVAPLAIITAPEPECGKSQLRDLMAKIVLRPLSTNNMKSATLFRIAEKWHPTLMLDEVDMMIKDDNEIINLVNAGHHRGACEVWRLVGDNHEPKAFNVWGAKCFAGIALEKLFPPSTLSRAIVLNLRKKLPHESVGRLRHAPSRIFKNIAAKLARFAVDYSHQVKQERPVLPDQLGDRAQDNWEPLLAIAMCAGDEWIKKATSAALKLSGANRKPVTTSNELLNDIHEIFITKGVERICTADLIKALCDNDDAGWGNYWRGKPITGRQLAKLLKPYDIYSKDLRFGYTGNLKGYMLDQFMDTFNRYLPTPPDTPYLFATTLQTSKDGDSTVAEDKSLSATRDTSATPKPAPTKDCRGIADKTPPKDKGVLI